MKFSYTLTADEFSDMVSSHFSQYKKQTYLSSLLLLMGLSFLSWKGTLDFSFILFVIIITMSLVASIKLLLPWRYRRSFKKQKMLSCRREMIFSEDDFTIITKYLKATIKYSSIEKVVYFNAWILIYLTHNNFHFIPTRIFKSDEEKEELLKIFEKTGSEIVVKG